MRKTAFVFLFSILTFSIAKSQNKKEYKLKKEEFIARHCGTDSLLKSTVNIYYEARKNALRKVYALPISLGLTGICSILYITQKNENNNISGVASYGIAFGAISSLISIPITLKGSKTASRYSRKILYEEVQSVKKGEKSSKQLFEETIRDYYIDFGD